MAKVWDGLVKRQGEGSRLISLWPIKQITKQKQNKKPPICTQLQSVLSYFPMAHIRRTNMKIRNNTEITALELANQSACYIGYKHKPHNTLCNLELPFDHQLSCTFIDYYQLPASFILSLFLHDSQWQIFFPVSPYVNVWYFMIVLQSAVFPKKISVLV